MSMKMLTTLVRSNDVEFGYSRVAMEEHNLLLRSDSFQSEHVQTAAAMERGGDPASEKCCHIHLMCIQSMRHNKQQWPAWLLKACWMQAEDNSCLDTTMAALSLNPFFTLKKKKKHVFFFFFFFFYSSLSPRHICISYTRQQRNPWTNRFKWKCISKLMNRTSRRMTVFQCRTAALTTLRCTWQNMELS